MVGEADIRFALTQAGTTAAERHGESIALYMDGVLLLEKSISELEPFLTVRGDHKLGRSIVSLSLPLTGFDVGLDLSAPFHIVEVAVGEQLTSRAEFRLEIASVEPFGCSRSAAVPPPAEVQADDSGDWYLPAEEAAYGKDEERIYSQNGEDGVLSAILVELGFPCVIEQVQTKRAAQEAAKSISEAGPLGQDADAGGAPLAGGGVYLEIGAGDGSECNTRILREAGWRGLVFCFYGGKLVGKA